MLDEMLDAFAPAYRIYNLKFKKSATLSRALHPNYQNKKREKFVAYMFDTCVHIFKGVLPLISS